MQIELAGVGWQSEWSQLSDSDFLKSLGWKRGTSAELTQAARKGDVQTFVSVLTSTWQLPENSAPPISRALWTLPAIVPNSRELELANLLKAEVRPKNKVATIRSKSERSPNPLEVWWSRFQPVDLTPWEYLALLEALPNRIGALSLASAFGLWRLLLQIGCDLNQLLPLVDRKPSAAEELSRYGFEADPFLDLSLFRNCELSWLTGVVFAPVKGADKMRKHGAELLEHELVERTDDQGTPHAALLPRWSMWLAIFTRFIQNSRRHGLVPWDNDAADLFLTTVEKTAPLIQPNGRLAFSRVEMEDAQLFIEDVLRTSGWSDAESAIRSLFSFPKRNGRAAAGRKSGTGTAAQKRSPEICVAPVSQSDEAAWAVMRTHWGAHADRVTIDHDQPVVNLELMIQGQPVLEGEWRTTLTVDQQPIPLHGHWSCVCWQSDPEGDYIEIQLTLPGIARIERQVLLSREQHFCLIAESLAEMTDGEFSLTSQLPLCDGVSRETDTRTREIRLTTEAPVRVFPIAIPDQHVYSTPAKFSPELSLTTTVRGIGWYNPVMFDWEPTRRAAPADWRALTVGEDRNAVKPGIASGYRLKVGDQQWLIYRSLQKSDDPRSVLGHQTRYETVIGSVGPEGDITPLMLVE